MVEFGWSGDHQVAGEFGVERATVVHVVFEVVVTVAEGDLGLDVVLSRREP